MFVYEFSQGIDSIGHEEVVELTSYWRRKFFAQAKWVNCDGIFM
jgi:hypothetical protein